MARNTCKIVYIIGILIACGVARAQVSLPSIGTELNRLPPDLDATRQLRPQVDDRTSAALELAEVWIDSTSLTAVQATTQAKRLASGVLRELQVAQDPTGADIEDRVIVVLVDSEDASGLSMAGQDIISRRDLSALGMTMLTLRIPAGADLPNTIQALRSSQQLIVDYNHLYDFTASSEVNALQNDAEESAATDYADLEVRVGIIDSAVMSEHRGVADIAIVSKEFVTTPGLRPQTHGTAVASLIAKSSGNRATVYAASVFFQLPNRAPGATAESLVAALDWLAEEQVDVINMSLAGPGNTLLEAAIARLIKKHTLVVAAVGNNGPSGEPLYPAAYDGVIGVTAVDKKNKVFRYANRGEQVNFAAVGVNVKVADSLSGGWRIESGTSMAAPHVAVVVSQLLRSQTVRADAVQSWLMANSKDLGRKGFDPIYGYGLVTQPPIVLSANQN